MSCIIIYVKTKKENYLQCGSVQPKPLFWFKSNTKTETQIGRYFSANTITNTETTFQRENLVSSYR